MTVTSKLRIFSVSILRLYVCACAVAFLHYWFVSHRSKHSLTGVSQWKLQEKDANPTVNQAKSIITSANENQAPSAENQPIVIQFMQLISPAFRGDILSHIDSLKVLIAYFIVDPYRGAGCIVSVGHLLLELPFLCSVVATIAKLSFTLLFNVGFPLLLWSLMAIRHVIDSIFNFATAVGEVIVNGSSLRGNVSVSLISAESANIAKEPKLSLPLQKLRPKCIVCLDERVATTLEPCGHSKICIRCANLVVKQNNLCPLCRTIIQRVSVV